MDIDNKENHKAEEADSKAASAEHDLSEREQLMLDNLGDIIDVGTGAEKFEGDYGAGNIEILEGLEAVRKRPGMYIGSTGLTGLHHLVSEIVDNAIDEALTGYCTAIDVSINTDGSITVSDNGRGIPTGIHPTEKISAATVVYTILHAGGKFGGGGYKVSGGLHGVGASVVNALSEWLELTVYDGKNIWYQKFNRGKYSEEIRITGQTDKTGTVVKWKPDPVMFPDTNHDYKLLLTRLREKAFLNAGLTISLTDLREDNKSEVFSYAGGITEYVQFLQHKRGAQTLHPEVIAMSGVINDVTVEIAFQYNNDFNTEIIRSFANNICTSEGGKHEDAFKRGLSKVVNDFLKKRDDNGGGKKKKSVVQNSRRAAKEEAIKSVSGEAVRECIIAVISVKLPECELEGQTKTKLGNPEVSPIVYKIITEKLTYIFEENPALADIIVQKAVNSQIARNAAKKALENSRKSGSTGLPKKLADCDERTPRQQREIYIVEGDSAGGSAIEGRYSAYQAILSLWGKMLNVEKSTMEKVYGNDKLTPIVQALGTGIGEEFDIEKLRYGRVVIMADADVDGSHIRTLLMTFFFRYMRPLIEYGHVYIAQPPLYKVFRGNGTKEKDMRYAFDEVERDRAVAELSEGDPAKAEKIREKGIQRYKGLGEMDARQLRETTLDPATRTMKRVDLDDAAASDEIFSILMGNKVEPRREFIEANAKYGNLDV